METSNHVSVVVVRVGVGTRENRRVFNCELLMEQFGRWIASRLPMNMDEVSIMALVNATHVPLD